MPVSTKLGTTYPRPRVIGIHLSSNEGPNLSKKGEIMANSKNLKQPFKAMLLNNS